MHASALARVRTHNVRQSAGARVPLVELYVYQQAKCVSQTTASAQYNVLPLLVPTRPAYTLAHAGPARREVPYHIDVNLAIDFVKNYKLIAALTHIKTQYIILKNGQCVVQLEDIEMSRKKIRGTFKSRCKSVKLKFSAF